MREFLETLFMMTAMLVVGLVINTVMLVPVVVSIVLGDLRWLLLLFVSIPFVTASVWLLARKH